MECDEQSLRDMLFSTLGDEVVEALLDKVENGEPVLMAMANGSTMTLENRDTVVRVLRECFGWSEA
jgi:hypothetical protein